MTNFVVLSSYLVNFSLIIELWVAEIKFLDFVFHFMDFDCVIKNKFVGGKFINLVQNGFEFRGAIFL